MSKKDIKQQQRQQSATPPPKAKTAVTDTFTMLERWMEKNDKKIFYTLLFLSTLFSLLLFDAKVSEGGDDSSYIQRSWSLLHEHNYPYFQGPGYPVALSLVMKLFGLNLLALKFFSLLCQVGFVWFTYKAFVKRIPYTVLFALLSFISLNAFIQYYTSQTFTETFFLFVQSMCLYVTFKIIDSIDPNDNWVDGLKKNYGKWLLFGLLFVLLTISKSIAFVTIAAILVYFLLKKNYKQAVYAVIAYAVMRVVYQLIVTAAFGPNDTTQLEMMMRVDLYKPELGHETVSGMITRFFMNFKTYMSLHLYRILNLRSTDTPLTNTSPELSIITGVLLLVCTIVAYRKNKFVFFSCLYAIVLCGGIFFGVQANNMQDRLIIIAMPLLFLMLFYAAYELMKRWNTAQILLLTFASIMLLITIGKTTVIANKNVTAFKKNMSGDIYYGYTPDWENFLRMSRYCADSLPEGAQVLSRKPNMSFIYANGKKFVGQYIVPTTNADSVKMIWKSENVQYVIAANLRMDPRKNTGRIVNTIQRMLAPYAQKYPQNVRLVKTIGETEPCELYQVTY